MIDARNRSFDRRRLASMADLRSATLATLSDHGQPRLVPICFVVADPAMHGAEPVIWSPLDAKPKRATDVRRLARVRDIEARPDVALLFDRWSEDWSQLAWLRASGLARLSEPDDDAGAHHLAVHALRAKYPQYRSQPIDRLPMLRIELTRMTWWEALPGST